MKKLLVLFSLLVATMSLQADISIYTVSTNQGQIFTKPCYLKSIMVIYPSSTNVSGVNLIRFYDSWTNSYSYPYGAYSNITFTVSSIGVTNTYPGGITNSSGWAAYTNIFGRTNVYSFPAGQLMTVTTNVVAAGLGTFENIGVSAIRSNATFVATETLLSFGTQGKFLAHGLYQTNALAGSINAAGIQLLIDYSPVRR